MIVKNNSRLLYVSLVLVAIFLTSCTFEQTRSVGSSTEIVEIQLAYVVDLGMSSEIWIADLLEHTLVVEVEGSVGGLQWSPDGEYLSWYTYDYSTHQHRLWISDSFHTPTVVIPATKNGLGHRWMPDGDSLFVLELDPVDGRRLNSYGLSVGTQEHVPVWLETLPYNTFPMFYISLDGQYIAYIQEGNRKLVVEDSRGSSWDIFDLPPGASGINGFDWSTDSRWLAFSVATERGDNIYISRPNGEELTQVTSGSGSRSDLEWSPSASRLAFSLRDAEDGNKLCYLDLSSTETYCWENTWMGGDLLWISDEEWIFTTHRNGRGRWDIYKVSLSDGVFLNLTQSDERESSLAVWMSD
jgi:Tol biopolymer transport system component